MLKSFFFSAVFTFITSTVMHAELTIAYDSIGGTISENQKIDLDLLKKIAKQNSIDVVFKPYPWKRSLLMVEKGRIDGVINASFKQNRANFAYYPMKDGKPDISKRLNDGNTYYIYKNRDSSLVWTGKEFLNPDGPVGAMARYAVLEDLNKHKNITIVEFEENVELIRSVARGELAAYAGSSRIVDTLLKRFPVLANNIVRESIPIRKKEYYVIFSKLRYQKHAQEIELLWNGLKTVNEKR